MDRRALHCSDGVSPTCARLRRSGEVPLLAADGSPDTFGSEVSLALGKGVSILVSAGHRKPPRLPGGTIDWPQVERVIIERVDLRDE